jgi:hypothetical protein
MEKAWRSMKGRPWASVRVWAGILLIALFGILSMARLLKGVFAFDPQAVGKDNITLYEQRFNGLKRVLPSRGAFGYLSEAAVPADTTHLERDGRFCATRYSLAPLILLDTLGCRQIIGNFHETAIDSETYREWNMEVLAKFGGVAWLLNRNVP